METTTVQPHEPPAGGTTLKIGEALSIYSVEAVRAACLVELTRSNSLLVDLEGVKSCDAVGVQVLIAAQRSAANAGKTLRFVNVPTTVSRAAERVGCTKLFSHLTS